MPSAVTWNPQVTDFPVGTTVVVATSVARNRGEVQTIRLDEANDRYYLDWGSGAVLTGTWVNRGQITASSDSRALYQRVL